MEICDSFSLLIVTASHTAKHLSSQAIQTQLLLVRKNPCPSKTDCRVSFMQLMSLISILITNRPKKCKQQDDSEKEVEEQQLQTK